MPEDIIKAAGVVMMRDGTEGSEVALIHRRRRDDWSLPKGKVDPGEQLPITAVREALEETGFHVRLGYPLPMQRYLVNGVAKEVHYWKARSVDGTFVENDEVDVLRWVPLDIARAALTYPRDMDILDAAAQGPTTSPLIILRHAIATKRAAWKASGHPNANKDNHRPLAEDGISQLPYVSALLSAYGITSIHSSDAKRCHDTVGMYAHDAGLPVVPEPGVSEAGFKADPDRVMSRAEEILTINSPVVLCSHRPVLPTLLRGIVGAAENVDPTDDNLDPALPPAGAIVLHRDAARLTRIVATERWLPTMVTTPSI